MEYPKNCKFYIIPSQRKVKAVMKYHGKEVSGMAICSKNDAFDVEVGKQLAYLRLKAKIAEKAVKFYDERWDDIYSNLVTVSRSLTKYGIKLEKCTAELDVAKNALKSFEESL